MYVNPVSCIDKGKEDKIMKLNYEAKAGKQSLWIWV